MSIATLSTLEQADFTAEQARALARVLEEDHQNLATKDDIKSLEARMATKDDIRFLEAKMVTKEETQSIREDIKDIQGDIKSMEAKMVTKSELNKINNNMIKWIVTGIFLNVGALYMLLKYPGA